MAAHGPRAVDFGSIRMLYLSVLAPSPLRMAVSLRHAAHNPGGLVAYPWMYNQDYVQASRAPAARNP